MVKVAVFEEGFISNKMAVINEMIKKETAELPAKIQTYNQRKGEIDDSDKKNQKINELKSTVTYWWQTYQADKNNAYAYQQYQSALAAYQRETANGGGEAISQAYKDLIKDPVDVLRNLAELRVVLDLKVLNLENDEPLWGGAVATAVTDKDGKFKLTIPDTGSYALFAVTSHRAFATQERYIFYRRVLLRKMGGSYTIDLNNEYEQVTDYTTGWFKETIARTKDLDLLKDVLFWIMKGNYGLNDVRHDPNLTTTGNNIIQPEVAAAVTASHELIRTLEVKSKAVIEETLKLPKPNQRVKDVSLFQKETNRFIGTAVIETSSTNSARTATVTINFTVTTQADKTFGLEITGMSPEQIH
jgi:hypothetical protein